MKALLLVMALMTVMGCATGEVYKAPSVSNRSAVIRFQKLEGWSNVGDPAVWPEAINGKRLSFWRMSDTTRLAAGRNRILVIGISKERRTRAYAELVLDAVPGEKYLVKRTVEMEVMHFSVDDSKGDVVAQASGQKKPNANGAPSIPYIPVSY